MNYLGRPDIRRNGWWRTVEWLWLRARGAPGPNLSSCRSSWKARSMTPTDQPTVPKT